MIKDWLHIHDFKPSSWRGFDNVEHWWTSNAFAHGGRRKRWPLFSCWSWEIWNERNPETFENVSTMPTIVFGRIKAETMNWVIAGAKHLGVLISGE
jgi:hypothetical protein